MQQFMKYFNTNYYTVTISMNNWYCLTFKNLHNQNILTIVFKNDGKKL